MSDEMRRELNGVKGRLGAVENRLGTVEDRVGKTMVAVARLTGEFAYMKQTLQDELRSGFSTILKRLDDFAPVI